MGVGPKAVFLRAPGGMGVRGIAAALGLVFEEMMKGDPDEVGTGAAGDMAAGARLEAIEARCVEVGPGVDGDPGVPALPPGVTG